VNKKTLQKLDRLREKLRDMKRVAIAFSGGVDSSFLLAVGHDELGDNAVAVTAVSPTYPQEEYKDAQRFTKTLGSPHIIIQTKELQNKDYAKNPQNRCYYCKKELFMQMKQVANQHHIPHILDGSNADDSKDYRPGSLAIKELGVKSPLKDVGLTKQEIRDLSKQMNLHTWDKPPLACLASRFPYGEPITEARLNQVYTAERFLHSLGLKHIRVRYHQDIARIETEPKEFKNIVRNAQRIIKKFKALGFTYITLDLQGYRTGSLNEVLRL